MAPVGPTYSIFQTTRKLVPLQANTSTAGNRSLRELTGPNRLQQFLNIWVTGTLPQHFLEFLFRLPNSASLYQCIAQINASLNIVRIHAQRLIEMPDRFIWAAMITEVYPEVVVRTTEIWIKTQRLRVMFDRLSCAPNLVKDHSQVLVCLGITGIDSQRHLILSNCIAGPPDADQNISKIQMSLGDARIKLHRLREMRDSFLDRSNIL